jgi:L-amino acid N-acyltransferase YncA
MTIRPVTQDDATAIAAIYNHYIVHTTISFEEEELAPEQMAARIADYGARLPWLVYEEDGEVLGYAYATPWRVRPAYRYSVESSVYTKHGCARRGIGAQLYGALIAQLRARELQVVIGGIAQPNEASVALHERLGFEKVAHFKRVGRKFGRWIDVGYWELQLA